MSTVVVVGNPKARSRTRRAAETVADGLTGRPPDAVVELADLGPALFDWTSSEVEPALDAVRGARLLIVASPTYKATYTGLLKLFLDRIGAGELAGTAAVPVMLGGLPRHSLAPEVFLKPVLVELGASTPTSSLFLLESEWETSPELEAWYPQARADLAGWVEG